VATTAVPRRLGVFFRVVRARVLNEIDAASECSMIPVALPLASVSSSFWKSVRRDSIKKVLTENLSQFDSVKHWPKPFVRFRDTALEFCEASS
jgi:hypothetical protein